MIITGKHMSEGRPGDRRGLTLVELLVTMVLSSIVMGAGFALFINSNRVHQSTNQVSMVQQIGRAVLDVMSNDLIMAGFGTQAHEDVTGGDHPEQEMTFTNKIVNNNNSPDVIQFKMSPGGMAIVATQTTCNSGDVCQLTVDGEQGHDTLRTGMAVEVLDARRQRLGSGKVDALGDDPTQLPINEYIAVKGGSVPAGAVVVRKAVFYSFAVNEAKQLLRCVRDNMEDPCDTQYLNVAPGLVSQNSTYVLSEGVEDMQISYLLDDQDDFLPTMTTGLPLQLADREKIRAVKIEVLVRSKYINPMITANDCARGNVKTKYVLGDRAIQLTNENCRHNYVKMQKIVHVPNMASYMPPSGS